MSTYTVAHGGERLDRIAKKLYGTEQDGTVEALLDANVGLAALGFEVPEGTIIAAPQRVATPASDEYVLAWE